MKEKNIVLFIGDISIKYLQTINELEKKLKTKFRIVVITNSETKISLSSKYKKRVDAIVRCNIDNKDKIEKKLEDIKNQILMICFFSEVYASLYINVLKVIKLKNSPSVISIKKSTDKIKMRRSFYTYNPKITPKSLVVRNKKCGNVISKKIGFPCMLKPVHLSKSRLVTASHSLPELEENLNNIFNEIDKVYKNINIKLKSLVLAEEMMNGKMYTTSVYVDNNQKMYFTPFVSIITSRDVGINDFHLYARTVPSKLNQKEIKRASFVAREGIRALGLKNTTTHIELMKLNNETWKIIEIGARIGGYRYKMFKNAYNFNHIENDILLKLNKKPIIKSKLIAYFSVIELFPEKKGVIKSIKGIKKIRQMKSFFDISIDKKVGEYAGFAKDGYTNVLYVILKNKNKDSFYKDFNRIRKIIQIKTNKSK